PSHPLSFPTRRSSDLYLFLVHQRDQTVALFGGLMLLLNLEILGIGRMALTDSVLIFFTTASLYGFWLGLHGASRVRRWIWAFYRSEEHTSELQSRENL